MIRESIPYGNAMRMKVAFSNAIAINLTETKRMVWISGMLAFDEHDQLIGKGDMAAQAEQCLKNIQNALVQMGGTMSDIVSVTVFVKDMSDLKQIHEVRLRYFSEPYPTSTLVKISDFVHPDGLIEINAQAVIDRNIPL